MRRTKRSHLSFILFTLQYFPLSSIAVGFSAFLPVVDGTPGGYCIKGPLAIFLESLREELIPTLLHMYIYSRHGVNARESWSKEVSLFLNLMPRLQISRFIVAAKFGLLGDCIQASEFCERFETTPTIPEDLRLSDCSLKAKASIPSSRRKIWYPEFRFVLKLVDCPTLKHLWVMFLVPDLIFNHILFLLFICRIIFFPSWVIIILEVTFETLLTKATDLSNEQIVLDKCFQSFLWIAVPSAVEKVLSYVETTDAFWSLLLCFGSGDDEGSCR